jgi:hypothetical protein
MGAGAVAARAGRASLVLGDSKLSDVVDKLGRPAQAGELGRDGRLFKVLRYAGTGETSSGLHPAVVPAHGMTLVFFEDVLVSKEVVDSFRAGANGFDDAKVGQIVEGRTTKDEVVALLGMPSGEAAYPAIANPGDRAIVYSRVQARSNALSVRFHTTRLIVSFDGADVVTDVQYAASGAQ